MALTHTRIFLPLILLLPLLFASLAYAQADFSFDYTPDLFTPDLSNPSFTNVPNNIDLLIDSDSYTPPFYRGRALPSAGTQLRVQARTYFRRSDGSLVPPSSIVYTWRQNGEVVGSVSGLGKQTAILPSPTLYGTDTISVSAISSDRAFSGTALVRLSSVQPVLNLYQDHPLFGILYHQAMGAHTSIPDSEMTFAAVLYFAQSNGPSDPRLQYKWRVDDLAVPTSSAQASEITINADKSSGVAAIALSVAHSTNYFMNPRGTWSVSFKSLGQTTNPFSNGFQ